MIKANELRIGNYVSYKTKCGDFITCGIYSIKDSDFVNVQVEHDFGFEAHTNYLQPIPLTEKWLLDFGFVKSEDDFGDTYHILDNNGFECIFTVSHWNGANKGSRHYNKWYAIGLLKGNRLKHVHQLQNLFFALTGEELTIKENE